MNNPITFTPMGIYSGITAVCGLIITLWAVVEIVSKIIEIFKKTDKTQNSAIEKLQSRLDLHDKKFADYDTYFKRDKTRLDRVDEAERVTQKALLALLSHALNGNDTEALKEARDDLQTYLTNK